jgi:hypothetical protein
VNNLQRIPETAVFLPFPGPFFILYVFFLTFVFFFWYILDLITARFHSTGIFWLASVTGWPLEFHERIALRIRPRCGVFSTHQSFTREERHDEVGIKASRLKAEGVAA